MWRPVVHTPFHHSRFPSKGPTFARGRSVSPICHALDLVLTWLTRSERAPFNPARVPSTAPSPSSLPRAAHGCAARRDPTWGVGLLRALRPGAALLKRLGLLDR